MSEWPWQGLPGNVFTWAMNCPPFERASVGRHADAVLVGERIIVGADVDAGALARIAKTLSRR